MNDIFFILIFSTAGALAFIFIALPFMEWAWTKLGVRREKA
jgi:hypothetical protein